MREPNDRAQEDTGPSQQVDGEGDVVWLDRERSGPQPGCCLGKLTDLVPRRVRPNDRMVEQLGKAGRFLQDVHNSFTARASLRELRSATRLRCGRRVGMPSESVSSSSFGYDTTVLHPEHRGSPCMVCLCGGL